ncbi:MAG: ABC transporter, partial [Verrucomicrobiae bacterium]|nr:ABC transporter [Verrucomicrobiae bacterium]
CDRVIIIDHGRIFFDGRLAEILDRFVDFKLVTIRLDAGGAAVPAELSAYGEVVERNELMVRMRVKRHRVIPVCKALLDELPVSDIDIQEVPIEEVIRRLFTEK